jgi:hypothetical protein
MAHGNIVAQQSVGVRWRRRGGVTVNVAPLSALAQSSQAAQASDVYHVHFAKAALGQTKALESELKQQDPKAPMPGHYLVLRQDYMVIEH